MIALMTGFPSIGDFACESFSLWTATPAGRGAAGVSARSGHGALNVQVGCSLLLDGLEFECQVDTVFDEGQKSTGVFEREFPRAYGLAGEGIPVFNPVFARRQPVGQLQETAPRTREALIVETGGNP
jgi:hypothetical protein